MKLAAEDRYQIVRDDYRSGPYIEDETGYGSSGELAGSGDIETLVTGFLATRIQLRADRKGRVTIVESRWGSDDSCPTCSMEYMKFIVKIDGVAVYRSASKYGAKGDPSGAEKITSIAAFNEWLSGGAA